MTRGWLRSTSLPPPSFFPPVTADPRASRSDTSASPARPTRSVSPSRTCRPSFSSAPISKWTRSGLMALPSAACTIAPAIRSHVEWLDGDLAKQHRGPSVMTEKTIDLDQHRGMAAQKATQLRRLLADVEANERALRGRRDELEAQLLAAPAENWHEAADKARYLLTLFAATADAQDPRRQTLIKAVLADFSRLEGGSDGSR